MSNSSLKDRFRAKAPKSFETEPMDSPIKGKFEEVLHEFIGALREEYDFVDVRLAKSERTNLIHLIIAPKYRLNQHAILLTFWEKDNGRKSIGIINSDEGPFTSSKEFTEFLERFMNSEPFLKTLAELKQSYEDDAEGMLRWGDIRLMTADDVTVVVPHNDFLKLAKAKVGDPVDLRVKPISKKYSADEKYKYLTADGHALEIKAVKDDGSGNALVHGVVVKPKAA